MTNILNQETDLTNNAESLLNLKVTLPRQSCTSISKLPTINYDKEKQKRSGSVPVIKFTLVNIFC